MIQMNIDVRTPDILKHEGRFVFQEIVDTPTYMLISQENCNKVKPITVVLDGRLRQYASLTSEERTLTLYQVFSLCSDLQVGSYYMLDRDIDACIRWHNVQEVCKWIHPGYIPRVELTRDDVRFIHSDDMGSSYNVTKGKFIACWKRAYKTFAELDARAEELKPKFDENLWRNLAKQHNSGDISIVSGTRYVKALAKGEIIKSHSNAELTNGWLKRLGVNEVITEEQYFNTLNCYEALGLLPTEALLCKDGVELSKNEMLELLYVDEKSIMLPTEIQFSAATYTILKDVLQKASGKYHNGGFLFDSSDEAQTVLAALLDGEDVNIKKSLQYYASTDAAADILLNDVDFTGKTIYEPHGGEGFLVRKSFDLGAKEVLTTEIYRKFHPALEATGAKVIGTDVFDVTPDMLEDVDAIVMNPPFTGGADVKHFNYLLSIIPRGIPIYAIMSGCVNHHNWKVYKDFRDYLTSKGINPIDIPAGSFKESGTNVSTVAIRIPQS